MRHLRWLLLLTLTSTMANGGCAAPSEGQSRPQPQGSRIESFEESERSWTVFKSESVDMDFKFVTDNAKEGRKALKIDYAFRDKRNPFIAFLVRDFGETRDWSRSQGVRFWTLVPKAARNLRGLSFMVYEDDGTAWIAQDVRKLDHAGWEESRARFSDFVYSSGKRKGSALDPGRVRKISVGIYQPSPIEDSTFSIYVDDITLIGSRDEAGGAGAAERPAPSTRGAPVGERPAPRAGGADDAIVDRFDSGLSRWSKNQAPTIALDLSVDSSVERESLPSLKLKYTFNRRDPFWGFADKDLERTRNWTAFDALSFWSFVPRPARDLTDLSVMIYEKDGSAYILQGVRSLKEAGWKQSVARFDRFSLAGDWTQDENGRLDLDQVAKVSIGVFQPNKFADTEFTIYVNDIRATSAGGGGSKTTATAQAAPTSRTLGKYEPPDGQVYHGVFAFNAPMQGWGGARSDWEKQIDPKAVEEYEKLAGRRTAILSFIWFLEWEFPADLCQRVSDLGKVPHIGLTTQMKPSTVVKGGEDGKIREWARGAKRYGKPVFVRLWSEMNGNWNAYSEASNPAETHERFIEAWRHVVNLFRAEGADNVAWVWAPTAVDTGPVHWTDYYPGDDYVDWVGMSVYSFLGNGDPESEIMGIYQDYAARKPIIIAEAGAADADRDPRKYSPGRTPANNPEMWIQKFFDTLESKAPRVKAFCWFNIDRERVWKIQESSSKGEIYRKRLSNPRYAAALSGANTSRRESSGSQGTRPE